MDEEARRDGERIPGKMTPAAGEDDGCAAVAPETVPGEADEADTAGEEVLGFLISGQNFGIDIMRIKEILMPRTITEVPRAPSFLAGVFSLRGSIVPVFDMHIRLGLEHPPVSGKERLIVVKTGTESDDLAGLLVDKVLQVVRICRDPAEPLPPSLAGGGWDFIEGVGRCGGRSVILLDPDRLIDPHAADNEKGH